MKRLLLPLPIAAALALGACGSDDSGSSSSTAANAPTTTSVDALPQSCQTNADAKIVSISKKADTGKVSIKNVGTVPFTPSKDIIKNRKMAKGDHVYLTYVPGPNNAKKGARATCLLPFGKTQ